MIEITKSATADTRTCDFANTTKETLLASSRTHIGDVVKAMAFFIGKLTEAAKIGVREKVAKWQASLKGQNCRVCQSIIDSI